MITPISQMRSAGYHGSPTLGWAGAQGREPAQALSLPSSRAPSPSRPAGELPGPPTHAPVGRSSRPRLPQLRPGLSSPSPATSQPSATSTGARGLVWRRGRAHVCVGVGTEPVCTWVRDSPCVCVCVYVSEPVCVCKPVCVCESPCVSVCVHASAGMWGRAPSRTPCQQACAAASHGDGFTLCNETCESAQSARIRIQISSLHLPAWRGWGWPCGVLQAPKCQKPPPRVTAYTCQGERSSLRPPYPAPSS